MNSDSKISVVLIDSLTAVRQLLGLLLLQEGLFNIVGEASTTEEALEIFRHIVPRLVIADLQLSELGAADLLKYFRERHQDVRVLLFTSLQPPASFAGPFAGRPFGYVSKYDSLNTLRAAIQTVAAGGIFWTSQAMRVSAANGLEDLSEKDVVILSMVAEGLSSKEIAEKLMLSSKTVDNKRIALMKRLHLKNTAGLTRYAIRQGIVSQ